MYFTLAVSAATAEGCAALAGAARDADPRIMPLPGSPGITWRAPDGRAAVLCWPADAEPIPAKPSASVTAVRSARIRRLPKYGG